MVRYCEYSMAMANQELWAHHMSKGKNCLGTVHRYKTVVKPVDSDTIILSTIPIPVKIDLDSNEAREHDEEVSVPMDDHTVI